MNVLCDLKGSRGDPGGCSFDVVEGKVLCLERAVELVNQRHLTRVGGYP